MTGLGIGQRQVVVTQQRRHVLAAGIALDGVTHHDHVRNGQRRRQGLGRSCVNFVVQSRSLRMLIQMVLELHEISIAIIVPHKEKRHPKVPF